MSKCLITLKDIGNVAWDFISAIYKSGWDMLSTDSNNIFFRNKVVAKFMLKIINSNISKNNRSKSNDKLVTINKLPSILVKLPKKINNIAKFFKKDSSKGKEIQKKSYT